MILGRQVPDGRVAASTIPNRAHQRQAESGLEGARKETFGVDC